MRKKFLIFTSLVLAFANLGVIVPYQLASAHNNPPEHNGLICHSTSSQQNPYNAQTVNWNSWDYEGHSNHSKDIIPAYGGFAGKNWDAFGQIVWANNCEIVRVTPANVISVDGASCENINGSYYTIPTVKGVEYFLEGGNGIALTAGQHAVTVNGSVTIIAKAATGYKLAHSVKDHWTFNFTNVVGEGDCVITVVPVNPLTSDANCEVKQGSYTIPEIEGISYYIGDELQLPGLHPVTSDGTITFTAVADDGYAFGDGVDFQWTHEFVVEKYTAEFCVQGAQSVTPVEVIFTAPTCSVLGYYTIPELEGVKYYVNNQVVAAGKHSVQNGTSVTVTAVAASAEFEIKTGATSSWTYKFIAPANCDGGGSVLGASTTINSLPNTSGNSGLAGVTLLSIVFGIALSAGAVMRRIFVKQF